MLQLKKVTLFLLILIKVVNEINKKENFKLRKSIIMLFIIIRTNIYQSCNS